MTRPPFDPMERYERNCAGFDHPARVPAWLALRELLVDRPGWRFELANGGTQPLWMFGLGGASRLVVTAVGPAHVFLYDSDADNGADCGDETEYTFVVDELREWLTVNEQKHAGYTAQQVEWGSALARSRLQDVDDVGALAAWQFGEDVMAATATALQEHLLVDESAARGIVLAVEHLWRELAEIGLVEPAPGAQFRRVAPEVVRFIRDQVVEDY